MNDPAEGPHPYAMARYDRLRAEGLSAAEAMAQAAPLFDRPPHAHDASAAPRLMLEIGERPGAGPVPSGDSLVSSGPDDRAATGLVAAEEDQASAAERLRATDLDTATDLRATPGLDGRTVSLTGARNAAATASAVHSRARRSARPWQRDFPIPIRSVLAAVAGKGDVAATARAAASRRSPQPPWAGPRKVWGAISRPGL